jgi:flagellin|tara:strand:+ start:3104 stop:3958 length:855 start_codon:yes stop_codon:yes gene_type:complete
MLNINTNYAASFAANAAKQTSSGLDSAMEKLSTGSRINYAKDDAAGLAISTRLSAEVQGLAMASRNAADAQSMIDTADGALGETQNLLLRMRELAVQSANGTMIQSDRDALNAEYQALEAEITRIDSNTSWAGKTLFDGSATTFQVGTAAGGANYISHTIGDMASATIIDQIDTNGATAGGLADADILTQAKAQLTITEVDEAIGRVSAERGSLGAVSNRLSSTMSNLDQVAVNLSASQGRIQDADFAAETGNLAKNQILQQAATAMLAQANASKSSVLTLIRN